MFIYIQLATIISSILVIYLTYYVRQKGRNQANVEDLNKLTKIVEDIKFKNSESLEKMKADLQWLKDYRFDTYQNEKEAIFEYYILLNKWILQIFNIQLLNYSGNNVNELQNEIEELDSYFKHHSELIGKLQLLVQDEELISKGIQASAYVEALHNTALKLLGHYKICLEGRNRHHEFALQSDNSKPMTIEIFEYFKSAYSGNEKEISEIKENFIPQIQNLYKEAFYNVNNFKLASKIYLESKTAYNDQ